MPNELNPNAEAWVAALRSGDYKRGQAALHELVGGNRDKPLFCCLGVACDLFAKANPTEGRWSGNEFFANHESSRSSLPRPVADWLGMRREPGFTYLHNGYARYGPSSGQNLVHDNDKLRDTFATIADTIEAHQEELFNA